MNTSHQLSLLPPNKLMPGEAFQIAAVPPETIDGRTSLTAAIGAFHAHMRQQGFSENTIKAFGGDLNLFRKYVGMSRPVSDVSPKDISNFMNYLRFERGVPCNMKSYQRRLTSIKVFFNFLFEQKALSQDPAAAIPHQPVITPLPEILHDDQVERLLSATRSLMQGEKKDARPQLLVSLILATGMKKSECMALKLGDIDLADAKRPSVLIRYADPRRRHKERKLRLPLDWSETLQLYREQYHPRETLFECTSRNLEYILSDLSQMAGLANKLSFEMLRWTSAVRDLKSGMREETLRQKLGLSSITWQEAGDKIKRLASHPL